MSRARCLVDTRLRSDCFTSRRMAFFRVEQQLHIRRIPFKPVASFTLPASPPASPLSPSFPSQTIPPSSTSKPPHLLSRASPYLVIQSSDLLRCAAKVAYPNIAIQCDLVNDTIKVMPLIKSSFPLSSANIALRRQLCMSDSETWRSRNPTLPTSRAHARTTRKPPSSLSRRMTLIPASLPSSRAFSIALALPVH